MGNLAFALSTTFNALATLHNGQKGREQAAEFHHQNREDAWKRFTTDINFRQAQFLFSRQQAEQALITRLEDREIQRVRDKQDRSFAKLSVALNGSTEGVWLHDPYTKLNGGIKSLRVLLQLPAVVSETERVQIEHYISQGIQDYHSYGKGYPIHFLTGVWKDSAASGSWIAAELHSWDDTIPTLILRLERSREDSFLIKADIFGFSLGETEFATSISFGTVENSAISIGSVLPLLIMASADIYFLTMYAKTPLLPAILEKHLSFENKGDAKILLQIIGVYRETIISLVKDNPEISLYVLLNLAEALSALSNSEFALKELQTLEAVSRAFWQEFPELVVRLKALYIKINEPENAKRIEEFLQIEKRDNTAGKPGHHTLKKFI